MRGFSGLGSFLLLLLLPPLVQPASAEYAPVHGLRMYYEVRGEPGRPVVVFLHGGMNSIHSSFARQLEQFSRTRRVIAIDQMGHGRTADLPGRALSYEAMAEDTAALLAHLGIPKADLVGWSDGGQIALRLAVAHPSLIRRVVASGVGLGASDRMRRNLANPQSWERLVNHGFPEGRAEYNRVSPDGARHWSVYAEKARSMWAASSWGFTPADLNRIKLPVMIVSGDRENVEEAMRVRKAIPQARLCVLPGTSHATFQERPEWLNRLVMDFLDEK